MLKLFATNISTTNKFSTTKNQKTTRVYRELKARGPHNVLHNLTGSEMKAST